MAWALSSAGHEVRVASQPDITEAIGQAGLTAVPVGSPLNLVTTDPLSQDAGYGTGFNIAETRPEILTWDYEKGLFSAYSKIADAIADPEMVDDLVRYARNWKPDLVIWDAMTYAGAIAARACGAAHVRTLFGLDHWARMRELYLHTMNQQPPEVRTDPFRDWLTHRLERYGCDFDEELVLGQRTIEPMLPPWMFFPVSVDYMPVRFIPYNGPAVAPEWVYERPERPRVVLTLGQTLLNVQHDRFPIWDILASVAALDVEVVATLNAEHVSAPSRIPDNVRLVDFVPLNEILPTCSAIIHHGGTGTIATALAHAVPQFIVPGWLWDERGAARRLVDRGVGLMADPAGFSGTAGLPELTRLLGEQSFKQTCEKARRELSSLPTPLDVVPELEELAAWNSR
jgi:glycosyltransferase (activator-dependent family)